MRQSNARKLDPSIASALSHISVVSHISHLKPHLLVGIEPKNAMASLRHSKCGGQDHQTQREADALDCWRQSASLPSLALVGEGQSGQQGTFQSSHNETPAFEAI